MVLVWIVFSSPQLSGQECPALLHEEVEAKTRAEVRVKAIRGWDKLLTWAFGTKLNPYPLNGQLSPVILRVSDPELLDFEPRFGFFSIYHPIVGVVTESAKDLQVVQCLLSLAEEKIRDPFQRSFATDEILAKVLAYRNLQEGDQIRFAGTTYLVEQVMDLWRGMPAFGLVPLEGSAPPILLFRGTDLTLTKERGWASVLSDLDVAGPGFRTFQKARPQIQTWLEEKKEAGTPARLVGFSLGGAFVLHCLIEMPELVSQTSLSSIFNAPGLSPTVAKRWKEQKEKPPHILYLTLGDLVPQIGTFFSRGYEVKIDKPLQVIEAHVTLMGLQEEATLTPLLFK